MWGWDDEEQAAYLDEHFRPGEGWSIVQVDGEDAGRLVVAESVDELYLAEIGLLPAWQGRGIGTAIIRSLTRDAAAAGKPLILRVLHVNTRARALYERLGFIPVRDIETHAYLRWAA